MWGAVGRLSRGSGGRVMQWALFDAFLCPLVSVAMASAPAELWAQTLLPPSPGAQGVARSCGAIPDGGFGVGAAVRVPAECAVASGMLRGPAAPPSAGDRRISWVFHENSPQVPWRRDAGEPALGSAVCSMPGGLGRGAPFAPRWAGGTGGTLGLPNP